MKPLTRHEGPPRHCANCGTAMYGQFCQECGQSIHSVLKPMHAMVEETVETVLHIDGRIVHTLPPLLFRPGFLTLEYFSGRRVRYIAPFRLMFVLCLLAFFVIHLAVNQFAAQADNNAQPMVNVSGGTFADAASPKAVQKELQRQLNMLSPMAALGVLSREKVDLAREDVRQKANQRLAELGAPPLSAADLAASPKTAIVAPTPQPLQIGWLPAAANARLNALGQHVLANGRTFLEGDATARAEVQQRVINGIFGALPPTLFVLIPLFAILLKLFYVFRRRLYMEHLIVALHSHAFLFLALLLFTLISMLSAWLRPHAAWTGGVLGWTKILLLAWMPIHLLIMQKRIYHQGWPMTVLKFWLIGWCYVGLLALALMIAVALGMAH